MPEALDALSLAEAALIALAAASEAADIAEDAELSAIDADESVVAGGGVVAIVGAVASDAADEAGASSFFPQADSAKAATMEASRSDFFMCVLKFIGGSNRDPQEWSDSASRQSPRVHRHEKLERFHDLV